MLVSWRPYKVLDCDPIERVAIYVDDILIPGRSMDKHLQLLDEVLEILEKAGMTVNLQKCTFVSSEANFVGFVVTSEGITKDPSYVDKMRELC